MTVSLKNQLYQFVYPYSHFILILKSVLSHIYIIFLLSILIIKFFKDTYNLIIHKKGDIKKIFMSLIIRMSILFEMIVLHRMEVWVGWSTAFMMIFVVMLWWLDEIMESMFGNNEKTKDSKDIEGDKHDEHNEKLA